MRYDGERALMPYLLSSESLIWTGRPPTGLMFRKPDAFLIPFSLAWGGFACFWEYSVYRAGAPLFFLLFGRFIYDILQRRKTVYALTGERILMLTGKTLNAWNLRDLPQATLTLSSDRRGTVSFGGITVPGIPGIRRSRVAQSASFPVFEKIENASDVYNMVQSAAGRLHERASDDADRDKKHRVF